MNYQRRKFGVRALVPVATASLLALTLAGCGGSAEDDDVVDAPAVTEEPQTEDQPDPAGEQEPALEPEQEPAPEQDPPEGALDSDAAAGGGIDAYIALEEEALPDLMTAFEGMYSDVEITSTGESGVEYTYTFAEAVDADAATAEFDGTVGTLEETAGTVIFPAMARFEVPSPREATFVYKNPDDSVVWEHTVTE